MKLSGLHGNTGLYGAYNATSGASSADSTTDPDVSSMRASVMQQTQNFSELNGALQSGDLAGAQSAFAAIQDTIANVSQSNGGKNIFDPNSPIGGDFQTLGNALQSGDVAGAQSAFATLRQDIRAARHHGGRHADASSSTDAATSATDSGEDNAATLLDALA